MLKPIKYVGIEVWQVGHKSQFAMLEGLIVVLQALTVYTMNGVRNAG